MAQGFSPRFACKRPQDRSSPEPVFVFNLLVVLFFANRPFIGIDSDTFFYFILELFGSAGIIIIISRKTVKITSGFSILIRQHYALIDNLMWRELKRSLSRTLAPISPVQGYPRRWKGAEVHKLFTVSTKQVRFPYSEHAASGI